MYDFNGTGFTLHSEFYAYESTFTGGVRLAVVNAGTPFRQLVTAPGAGRAPRIRYWKVATQTEMQAFDAPVTDLPGFPAYTSGVHIARMNDRNGDGKDELAISLTSRQVFWRSSQAGDGTSPIVVSPGWAYTGVFVATGGVKIVDSTINHGTLAFIPNEACYTDPGADQSYGQAGYPPYTNYNTVTIPYQASGSTLVDYAPPVAAGSFMNGAFLMVGNRLGGITSAPVKFYGPTLTPVLSNPLDSPLFGGQPIGYPRTCIKPTKKVSPYGYFMGAVYVAAE